VDFHINKRRRTWGPPPAPVPVFSGVFFFYCILVFISALSLSFNKGVAPCLAPLPCGVFFAFLVFVLFSRQCHKLARLHTAPEPIFYGVSSLCLRRPLLSGLSLAALTPTILYVWLIFSCLLHLSAALLVLRYRFPTQLFFATFFFFFQESFFFVVRNLLHPYWPLRDGRVYWVSRKQPGISRVRVSRRALLHRSAAV